MVRLLFTWVTDWSIATEMLLAHPAVTASKGAAAATGAATTGRGAAAAGRGAAAAQTRGWLVFRCLARPDTVAQECSQSAHLYTLAEHGVFRLLCLRRWQRLWNSLRQVPHANASIPALYLTHPLYPRGRQITIGRLRTRYLLVILCNPSRRPPAARQPPPACRQPPARQPARQPASRPPAAHRPPAARQPGGPPPGVSDRL